MPDPTRVERYRRFALIASAGLFGFLLYRVLEPFLAALCWAAILSLAIWPGYMVVRRRLSGGSWVAPTLAVGVVAVVILAPMGTVGLLLAMETRDLATELQSWLLSDPDLPATLRTFPIGGEGLSDHLLRWRQAPESLSQVLSQNTEGVLGLASRAATNVGRNAFKFLVCIFSMWFLLRRGDELRDQIAVLCRRVGGARGEELLARVKVTVRATFYGLVMTALVQAVLTSLGFWVAGSPYPLVLGALVFVFSFIPFGPPLVWGPAALAILFDGRPGWGIAMLIWGALVVSSMDNVLRPIFIGQATKMPVILVFMGVIGGATAFGMVGLFLGPVIMAVAQAIWEDWVAHKDDPRPAEVTS